MTNEEYEAKAKLAAKQYVDELARKAQDMIDVMNQKHDQNVLVKLASQVFEIKGDQVLAENGPFQTVHEALKSITTPTPEEKEDGSPTSSNQ